MNLAEKLRGSIKTSLINRSEHTAYFDKLNASPCDPAPRDASILLFLE
jgi:hypothetical protein